VEPLRLSYDAQRPSLREDIMEQYQQIASVIALSMGAAWASGINLYAALLMLGLMSAFGALALPASLQLLANPWVIAAAGIMFVIEFFADKIPGVDSAWDAVHTFIRIPAGAVLAAAALGQVDPALALAAAIVGGGVAAATHTSKAGTRLLINTSPEPFSNWTASVAEDVLVIAGIWTAVSHPWLFLALFIAFMLLLLWVLPKIWRGVRKFFAAVKSLFKRTAPQMPGG
jgi:hypothetical protein